MSESILADEPHAPQKRPSTRGHYQIWRGQARDELRTRAMQMYGEGFDTRAIAEKFGTSYTTTRRLLLEAGVEFRPHGGYREPKTRLSSEAPSGAE